MLDNIVRKELQKNNSVVHNFVTRSKICRISSLHLHMYKSESASRASRRNEISKFLYLRHFS